LGHRKKLLEPSSITFAIGSRPKHYLKKKINGGLKLWK